VAPQANEHVFMLSTRFAPEILPIASSCAQNPTNPLGLFLFSFYKFFFSFSYVFKAFSQQLGVLEAKHLSTYCRCNSNLLQSEIGIIVCPWQRSFTVKGLSHILINASDFLKNSQGNVSCS